MVAVTEVAVAVVAEVVVAVLVVPVTVVIVGHDWQSTGQFSINAAMVTGFVHLATSSHAGESKLPLHLSSVEEVVVDVSVTITLQVSHSTGHSALVSAAVIPFVHNFFG
jgi:hypothetical protein